MIDCDLRNFIKICSATLFVFEVNSLRFCLIKFVYIIVVVCDQMHDFETILPL